MRARVVYESMFGNTAAIARAIADGLRAHADVEVLSVVAAAEMPEPTIDLLVVGDYGLGAGETGDRVIATLREARTRP